MNHEPELNAIEWLPPQTVELIEDTSETVESIDPEEIAAALGARNTGHAVHGIQSSMTIFALRQMIFADIVSTGGRPSLKGDTIQKKIRIRKEDWKALKRVAIELSTDEKKVTPTHLAGVLVGNAVAEMSRQLEYSGKPKNAQKKRKE